MSSPRGAPPSTELNECFLLTKFTFLQWHLEIKAQGGEVLLGPQAGGRSFPIQSILRALSSISELAYSQSSLFLEKPRLPLTKQAVLAISDFCCHCQCRQLHVAVSTSGWVLRLTVLAGAAQTAYSSQRLSTLNTSIPCAEKPPPQRCNPELVTRVCPPLEAMHPLTSVSHPILLCRLTSISFPCDILEYFKKAIILPNNLF